MWKKIFQYIPEWLLLPLLAIVALIFWPIILVIIAVTILFGNRHSDSVKVEAVKMIILIVAVFVIYWFIDRYQIPLGIGLDHVLNAIFSLPTVIVLVILATLQKYFPSWKWLAKKSNTNIV